MTERHMVPAPEIRKLLVANHRSSTGRKGKEWAALNGLAWDTILQILKGKRKHVEFATADRIICALECPEAWYQSLAPWYFPPGETPPESFEKAQTLFT